MGGLFLLHLLFVFIIRLRSVLPNGTAAPRNTTVGNGVLSPTDFPPSHLFPPLNEGKMLPQHHCKALLAGSCMPVAVLWEFFIGAEMLYNCISHYTSIRCVRFYLKDVIWRLFAYLQCSTKCSLTDVRMTFNRCFVQGLWIRSFEFAELNMQHDKVE